MANYNPHAPIILGEEWVGIRNEDFTLSPAVNVIEQGHRFVLAQTRIIRDVRFYIRDFPPGDAIGQVYQVAIYNQGAEDQSGPIQSVIIPCNAATLSGGAIATTTAVRDLADPSDANAVLLSGGVNSALACSFPINSYVAPLSGKRIVGVNVLYTYYCFDDINDVDAQVAITDNTNDVGYGTPYGTTFGPAVSISKQPLGSVNHFWSTSSPFSTTDRLPWRFTAMQKFESASANPIKVKFSTLGNGTSTNVFIGYVALEVLYCDEQRLMYGGRIFGSSAGTQAYTFGVNIIPMRSLASVTTDPPLVAGAYTLTISSGDPGSSLASFGASLDTSQYPPMNAVRQKIALTNIKGGRIRVPSEVGQVFTYEDYDILPHLSVHTTGTGAPLNEVHVYGRVIGAPVYGAVTATQTIDDDQGAPARQFPQVRYYARRYGDTTQPLVLSTTSPTISGSSASITVAEFDAMQEIVDGWKEITLRFNTPPTMGAISGNPGWTWSSSAETVGNRWEVLGVSAPAISGVPGNDLQQVPSAQRLGPATYGAVGLGDQASLTWLSPIVTGATADAYTDAVVHFSTDMPTITGVGVTELTLTVTGIGTQCNISPTCVPTGILYNRVTWSATPTSSVPATGFGYYELQRFDTEDNAWTTIMLTSSQAVTGFSDYEARVGIQSQYRIRGINTLNFAGQWSSTVSRTLTSPGVAPSDSTGVLIFTANARQGGNNFLAYTMNWPNSPNEQIDFVEANWQQLQPMYGKNFLTAFRSSERGGEQFSRALLMQKAAVSGTVLDKAAMNIRDLAWDDVPYVCVRTEQGDRWYANVRVPSVDIRRYRRLQMVNVEITEVTETPYPVDPAV